MEGRHNVIPIGGAHPGTGVRFDGKCSQCGMHVQVTVIYPDRHKSVGLLERMRTDGKAAIADFNRQHEKRCISRIV